MASRVVRARLDERSEEALAVLLREGGNESEVVRSALVEAAARRMRRSALAAEVAALAANPVDRTARRRVLADMDAAGSDWPA